MSKNLTKAECLFADLMEEAIADDEITPADMTKAAMRFAAWLAYMAAGPVIAVAMLASELIDLEQANAPTGLLREAA